MTTTLTQSLGECTKAGGRLLGKFAKACFTIPINIQKASYNFYVQRGLNKDTEITDKDISEYWEKQGALKYNEIQEMISGIKNKEKAKGYNEFVQSIKDFKGMEYLIKRGAFNDKNYQSLCNKYSQEVIDNYLSNILGGNN